MLANGAKGADLIFFNGHQNRGVRFIGLGVAVVLVLVLLASVHNKALNNKKKTCIRQVYTSYVFSFWCLETISYRVEKNLPVKNINCYFWICKNLITKKWLLALWDLDNWKNRWYFHQKYPIQKYKNHCLWETVTFVGVQNLDRL